MWAPVGRSALARLARVAGWRGGGRVLLMWSEGVKAFGKGEDFGGWGGSGRSETDEWSGWFRGEEWVTGEWVMAGGSGLG